MIDALEAMLRRIRPYELEKARRTLRSTARSMRLSRAWSAPG